MGDLTLFEVLTGGAFDRLNWQHSGEFDKKFSKKSNAPGFARGGWAVLELTGTLFQNGCHFSTLVYCKLALVALFLNLKFKRIFPFQRGNKG